MQDSPSIVNTIDQADQSHDSVIKIVWKIIYWILALSFIGFGLLPLIGGSEWWGIIFVINGFLFIYSSTSLNEKSRKILKREIAYLFCALLFWIIGLFIIIGVNQLLGIICFVIMTLFSILTIYGSKETHILEKFYKKTGSLPVNAGSLKLKNDNNSKPNLSFGILKLTTVQQIIGGTIATVVGGIILILIQKIFFS